MATFQESFDSIVKLTKKKSRKVKLPLKLTLKSMLVQWVGILREICGTDYALISLKVIKFVLAESAKQKNIFL